MFNDVAFAKMKENAILLNLGRGPIIVEKDLADALCHFMPDKSVCQPK